MTFLAKHYENDCLTCYDCLTYRTFGVRYGKEENLAIKGLSSNK